MIFDAIITDRSTASRRICWSARAGFQLNLALGVPDDAVGLGPRLLPHLLPQPLGVRAALRDDRLGLDARLADDLRPTPVPAARAPASPSGHRPATSGSSPDGFERLQQRPPGKLRQQRQQDQEGDDGPDEQPGSGWTSGLSMTRPSIVQRGSGGRATAARSAARTLPRESRRLRAGRAAG